MFSRHSCCFGFIVGYVPLSFASITATSFSKIDPSPRKIISHASQLPSSSWSLCSGGHWRHQSHDSRQSCFISYKSVSGLSVRKGNNSFVLVLGRGTAIFSLNGKRILVRNVLHIPGLAVPLYSLRTHVTQRSCGFIGTGESGFLVYFPSFVL